VLLPLPPKRKADHVTDERAAQRRAMATRSGGDIDRRPRRRFEPRRGPWLKSASVTPEALRSGDGGDDGAHRWQQRSTGGVEVVVVLSVAEQHRVDRAELGSGYRRPAQLARPQPNR
jgi:hypothetical protein